MKRNLSTGRSHNEKKKKETNTNDANYVFFLLLKVAQRAKKVKHESHDIMRRANLRPIYLNCLVLTYACIYNDDKYTQLCISPDTPCALPEGPGRKKTCPFLSAFDSLCSGVQLSVYIMSSFTCKRPYAHTHFQPDECMFVASICFCLYFMCVLYFQFQLCLCVRIHASCLHDSPVITQSRRSGKSRPD